jgi:hypothetical protein
MDSPFVTKIGLGLYYSRSCTRPSNTDTRSNGFLPTMPLNKPVVLRSIERLETGQISTFWLLRYDQIYVTCGILRRPVSAFAYPPLSTKRNERSRLLLGQFIEYITIKLPTIYHDRPIQCSAKPTPSLSRAIRSSNSVE